LADGTYFVALGGFNSSFSSGFNVNGGGAAVGDVILGNFTLSINGSLATGTLLANEVIFFSFNVGNGATQAPNALLTSNPETFTTASANEFARVELNRPTVPLSPSMS